MVTYVKISSPRECLMHRSITIWALSGLLVLGNFVAVVPAARADSREVTAEDWARHAAIDDAADRLAAVKIARSPKLQQSRTQAGFSALAASSSSYTVGKILVTVAGGSSSSTTSFDGHAGIAQGSGYRTIEAWPGNRSPTGHNGVQRYNINWVSRYAKVRYMVPYNSSTNNGIDAYNQAVGKLGSAFSIFPHKDTWNQTFYCSHLVYGAWKRAGFNVDTDVWDPIVTPKEIVASPRTQILWST